MQVKLINKPQIEFIDKAIGMCYDKGCHTDKNKMHNRIHKVANVSKHSSVLEFTEAIFEITASTKVLLEMTRHRHANYACQSSRYTLDKSEIVFESTGDIEVDDALYTWRELVIAMIKKGKKNDITSLMLPQTYQYKWVAKFNYRSLQNFIALRTDKHAHFQIQEVANAMLNKLPKEHRYLFEDIK